MANFWEIAAPLVYRIFFLCFVLNSLVIFSFCCMARYLYKIIPVPFGFVPYILKHFSSPELIGKARTWRPSSINIFKA